MVELKSIMIKYGDFIAVNNVDITIQDGEFFTLLGPSGCGKTTTLRGIAGFERICDGEIFVDGKNVVNLSPEERKIGFVFQNYALFPTMSVFENIGFGLKVRKKKKDEIKRKTIAIAKKVGVEDHLSKKISELSGGQQQRVAIARALVLEPKILLMDEPLSNLDAKLRVSMREEIKKLQKELGIIAIYVTHDQEEAMAISDRIAVFNNGKIDQIGTPREIYHKPTTQFVAKFIGDINKIPKNLVKYINKNSKEKLEVNNGYYIRTEQIKIQKEKHSDKGFVNLDAKVANIEFLGAVTKIKVVVEEFELVCVSYKKNDEFIIGDAVRVVFPKQELIQFEV
ncbi:ABC transporter ATP-binding protein [Vallitalea guaymasensis]|uniref:ABC transporter ATP-binding protein n=1 Tax=Vallitalea guaymasensis TaxID=1185412 RepID=UPI002352B531|nr:ABC transporter ATP-binding protein [Vallitalea guaymasensis]